MKNNLIIVATYAGNSGASHSLVKLADELQKKYEYNILVVCPVQGYLTEELEKKKINYTVLKYYPWVININKKKKKKEKIKWFFKRMINFFSEIRFDIIIRKFRPDIIHINASTSSFGANRALKHKIPLVWHFREFLEEDLQKTFWNNKRSLELISKSDAQIAISRSVKEKFEQRIEKDNIHVIYNGIDDYKFCKKDINGYTNKIKKISILGRVTDKKGQLEAIQAIAILVNRFKIKNIKLEIAGPLDDTHYYNILKKEISNLKIEEYCSFVGEVKNSFKYLDTIDISLVCSESEAFGRVTVESIFRNAFVLGKNTAGTAEILSDKRIMYDDVEELASKLKYFIENESEMIKITKNIKPRIFNKFKSSSNSSQINKLYLIMKEGR